MKEVYRNPDPIKVSFYKQLLEAEGIATLIRPNVDAMKSGFQTVPLWEWYCANDSRYGRSLVTGWY